MYERDNLCAVAREMTYQQLPLAELLVPFIKMPGRGGVWVEAAADCLLAHPHKVFAVSHHQCIADMHVNPPVTPVHPFYAAGP